MWLTDVVWTVLPVAMGAGLGVAGWLWLSRLGRRSRGWREPDVSVRTLVERVRSVGKLVGLEVCAKEIATATRGWGWLPPVVLSPARLAMIFQFEKQYAVDLSRVGPADVVDLGGRRFRVRLPEVEGVLRLCDVTPYDIQDGKVLGLVDVIPMNAAAQKELMTRAQRQASELFESQDARYRGEARRSIERHLTALVGLFGAEVQIEWGPGRAADGPVGGSVSAPAVSAGLRRLGEPVPA